MVPAGPRAAVLSSETPCFKFEPVGDIVPEDSSLVIPRELGGCWPEEDAGLREQLRLSGVGKLPAKTKGPLG